MAARLAALALLGGEGLVALLEHEGAVDDLSRCAAAIVRVGLARRVRQTRVPDDVVARLCRLGVVAKGQLRTVVVRIAASELSRQIAELLDEAVHCARARRSARRWQLSRRMQRPPPLGQPLCRHPQDVISELLVLRERRETAFGRRHTGEVEEAYRRCVEAGEHAQRPVLTQWRRIATLHERLERSRRQRLSD